MDPSRVELPPSNAGPPARLQLSRRRGFDLQMTSRRLNGLGAVRVARPSRWGNHWRVGPDRDAAQAVALFREDVEQQLAMVGPSAFAPLRRKNLACWCALDEPCHADVLLDLANRPICTDADDRKSA